MNILEKLQDFFSSLNKQFMSFGDTLLNLLKRHGKEKNEKARLLMLRLLCDLCLAPDDFDVLYQGKVNRPPVRPELLFKLMVAKDVLDIRSDRRLLTIVKDSEEIREILGFEGIEEVPCRATISRFRSKLRRHYKETGENLIEKIINSLIQTFQFTNSTLDHTVVYRIDSTMVDAFIREHNRLELFYITLRAFVNDLNKKKLSVPEQLRHYLDKGEFNVWFYRKKKEKIDDLLWFCLFEDIQTILGMDESVCSKSDYFEIVKRLVDEQTRLDEDGSRVLKDPSEVPSNSLQSPFDPEATYRYKNGSHVGYVVNFVEMIVLDEQDKIKARSLVYYQLEQNIYSDAEFLKDFLERYPKTDGLHQMVCDGAYFSDENSKLALEKGFELVPTDLVGKKPNPFMAGFELNSAGTKLVSCPEGKSPNHQSHYEATDMIRASFKKGDCQNCPSLDKCKPDLKKRVSVRTVSRKMVDRAKIIKHKSSAEYSRLSNIRNGIEAVPSQLKSRYEINKIRHRGIFGTSMDTGIKILSLALVKLTNDWAEFGLPTFDLNSVKA